MAPRKIKNETPIARWHVSHVPLPSWIVFWSLVLTTLALIVVCFNNAFVPVSTDVVDDQTALQFQAIRASLEKQVNDLQAKETQQSSCDADASKWNTDPSNIRMNYIDQQTGVQASLPYNFAWGDGKSPLEPYELVGGQLMFGPAANAGECTVRRDVTLYIDPPTSTKAYANAMHLQNPKLQTIAGLSVIKVTQQNEMTGGQYPEWFASGRSHSYRIVSDGWLTDVEAIKIIQSLKVVK
jgi:hypothetical protein